MRDFLPKVRYVIIFRIIERSYEVRKYGLQELAELRRLSPQLWQFLESLKYIDPIGSLPKERDGGDAAINADAVGEVFLHRAHHDYGRDDPVRLRGRGEGGHDPWMQILVVQILGQQVTHALR